MSSRKHDKKGRSKGQLSSFVALEHFLLECEAWQSLSLCARQAYVEIARIYSGTNNGRLALSARGLSERLKVSKATASRSLRDLGERGFVEIAKHGGFTLKNGNRRAAEWRLTRFKCDVTGQLPSKQFMAWKASKIHLAVSSQAHPGFTRGTQRAATPSKGDFVGTTRDRNGVSAMQSGLTTGPHIDIYHTVDTKHTASNGEAGRANQRPAQADATTQSHPLQNKTHCIREASPPKLLPPLKPVHRQVDGPEQIEAVVYAPGSMFSKIMDAAKLRNQIATAPPIQSAA